MSGRIRIAASGAPTPTPTLKNKPIISSVDDLVGELVSRRRRMSSASALLPSQVTPPASTGDIYTEDTQACDINEGDIEKFAELLGIDLEKEPHFRPLVEEGVLAPLPPEWKPCKDRNKDQFYYFNIVTNISQWEHPLNAVYREKVLQFRQEVAMNRMQSSDFTARPPKSLPPLKKLGLGRPPSALSVGQGQNQSQSQGQGQNQPFQSQSSHRLNDHLTLNRVNVSLAQLNRELVEYDGLHDSTGVGDLSDLPPPSSRMVKKPLSSPLMLTEDEKRLMSQLSIPLKDKQGVKFSLDEPTELTFDPVDDSVEKVQVNTRNGMYPKENTSSTESSLEESEDHGNQRHTNYPPPPIIATPTGKAQRNQILESGLQDQKLALRQEMEEELKKYQEILEFERKEREAQMKKELETSLEQIRQENDALFKKSRSEIETRQKIELDSLHREQELILETEIAKMTTIFQTELEKRKSELQSQHDAAMSRLSQDFDQMDDTQKSDLYNKTLAETTQKLNTQLKEHKEALREEQRKQLQQMRDYHQTFSEKLKKELASEEATLQSEHNQKLARIRDKFQKEAEQLETKLSQEQGKARKPDVLVKNTLKSPKPTPSDKSPSKVKSPLPKSTEDVKLLSEKYTQLEKKYSYLKKELRKITEVATIRHLQGSHVKKTKPVHTLNSSRNSESDLKSESASPSVAASIISESGDSTTAYPSSYNNPGNHGDNLDSEHRGSGENSAMDDIVEKNNEKLACALKSLETLKQQILEIQQGGASGPKHSNDATLSTPVTPRTGKTEHISGRRIKTAQQLSNNTSPSTPTNFNNAPKRKQVNLSNSSNPVGNNGHVSSYQKRMGSTVNSSSSLNNSNLSGRRLRASKSTPELPGLLEAVDSDESRSGSPSPSPHKIVQDAKEFIRTQKERLNLPQHPQNQPSPTELALKAIHNSYNMLSSNKPSYPDGGHLFSETESSGIGSLTFLPNSAIPPTPGSSDLLKSTEKKKISKDIEAICSSLSHLDEQMKLMWNVVNTSNSSSTGTGPNAIFDMMQNPHHYPMSARVSSSNDAFSTNNANAYLSGLPLTARLSPSNLLNSLDKELKVFKATKERILDQFSNPSKNNNHNPNPTLGELGSGGDTRDGELDLDQCIQDKTKDLREWLEKF